jgi:hypothetical protein
MAFLFAFLCRFLLPWENHGLFIWKNKEANNIKAQGGIEN